MLPLYKDNLVSEISACLIDEHIKECDECNSTYTIINKSISVNTSISKPNKKMLFYVYSTRLWYLLCPFIAFSLFYFNLEFLLCLYEGFLILFSGICVYSQFCPGLNQYGIYLDELKTQQKALKDEKNKWGFNYISPISLCLPSLLVIGLLEIPKLFL